MSGSNARKFFEDSHEYREQKIAGKKCANNFYNHKNVDSKKMDFKKTAENSFRFTRISRAKYGVKIMGEKIFEDSHEYRQQKMAGKNARIFL